MLPQPEQDAVLAELLDRQLSAAPPTSTLMAHARFASSPPEPLPRGPMRTVPVRFPEQQYERLKRWCEGHEFPMAVVVRGLVEHFLDQQDRLASGSGG